MPDTSSSDFPPSSSLFFFPSGVGGKRGGFEGGGRGGKEVRILPLFSSIPFRREGGRIAVFSPLASRREE